MSYPGQPWKPADQNEQSSGIPGFEPTFNQPPVPAPNQEITFNEFAQQAHARKKKKAEIISWVVIGLGCIGLMTGVMDFVRSLNFVGLIQDLMYASALIGPGAYWHYCEARDAKARKNYEESVVAWKSLKPEDLAILGPEPTKPEPMNRRWPVVALIIFLLIILAP